jgi:hypothetical protein
LPIPLTAFAVRFFYGASVTLDFDVPAMAILIPPRPVIAGNRVYSGKTEWLYGRMESQLSLTWMKLTAPKVAEVWTWWSTWYALGKQTAIILDRLGTATGQWEYDQWNTTFTKAEPGPDLTVAAFPLTRTVLERPAWTFGPITFRQGS